MAGLRERAEGESVAELLESVLHDTGYLESLEAERTLEAEGRMENLQELVGVAGEFDVNRDGRGPVARTRRSRSSSPGSRSSPSRTASATRRA